MAGSPKRDEAPSWGDRSELSLLNNDVPRLDGPAKVTGRAKYPHDIRLPGMVYGRMLVCPHPAARVAKLDVSPALEVEGVVDAMALEEERTRYLGQPVAVVAAETPEAAEDGVRAIVAEYDESEGWVVTYDQAVADGAPQVSDRGNKGRTSSRDEGDVETSFEDSDVVLEETYTVPVQNHACLETHGLVVDYDGGDSAKVYASTQGTFLVVDQCTRPLGLDKANIESDVQYMGGGFGGKFGIGIEGRTACELAKKLGRPVHMMFDRKAEFVTAGNRSGNRATLKGGATKDGTFKALQSEVYKLGGVSRGSYPGQPYIYSVESYKTDVTAVHTNTDGNRAMRAPGHPQASWGIESMVDELAYAIGMDPVEFRKKNLESEVYHRQLDRVAREIGWHGHANRTKPGSPNGDTAIGIGFGVSTWGGGGRPSCEVDVKIGRDGSVDVSVGTQDLGTGTRTYVATIVAEEFGLPLDAVNEHIGNSKLGNANASGGSVTTGSLAPAVKMAAHNARLALLEKVGSAAGLVEASLELKDGAVVDPANEQWQMTWKQACATLPAEGLSAHGSWEKSLQDSGVHGAQAVSVEVDLLTGAVKVLKMICIQDVGLPLNRLAVRSQINGGMIQALSYALLEDTILDPWLGTMLNANMEEYKIAGPMEMPEMVSIIDEDDIDRNPIGVGEPPVIPGASAIGNAVYNACGARIRSLPITPDKVLNELVRLRQAGGAK